MTVSELLDFDRKHLWHPYASTTTPPPANPVVSASGVRIRLADGHELIDGISSWWCMAHGHNHPAVIEAIHRQSEKFAQVMFAGFTHEPAVHLAELLLESAPSGMNHVFYADSGSVCVECAAKMALQYQFAAGKSKRTRLASVKGGYHGDTTGAMALSDPDGMHKMFAGVLPQHFFAPQPRTRFDEPWEPTDFEPMKQLLEEHQQEIAAVILEPIFQGANAMRFYHPQYLRELRKICDRYDILLIFDEIATGFGRIGKFFAAEYPGVSPDLMCVGKALTGGAITLAALLTSKKVGDTISHAPNGCFLHGPTFMANPLACAAGCASLELFKQYDWAANVRAIEAQLKAELSDLKECPNVRNVRILGAVGAVELKQTPTPEAVQKLVLETGVWLRPFDRYLYTMPPFVTSAPELHAITQAMKAIANQPLH